MGWRLQYGRLKDHNRCVGCRPLRTSSLERLRKTIETLHEIRKSNVKNFRIMGLLLATALVASACTAAGATKVDVAIQQNLPKVCSAIEIAHVAFTAVASTGKIKSGTVIKEGAAFAGVEVLCNDPSHATAVSASIRVAQAYVVITQALREAKVAGNG